MQASTALRAITTATAALAAAAGCWAAPVSYDEAVSGDLPGFGTLTQFALDLGVNTVRGTLALGGGRFDLDSFAFTVAAGQVLAAASLSLVDAQGNISKVTFNFDDQSGLLESLDVLSPGTGSLNASYGAGTYEFVQTSVTAVGGGTANYVFSLTVAPDAMVPEPTSLALAGSALGGLALARRRAQRRPATPCPRAAPRMQEWSAA